MADNLPRDNGLERRNSDYLASKISTYPYLAKTPLKNLNPREVEDAMAIQLIRIPYPKSKFVIWGFDSQDTRDQFIKRYGGLLFEYTAAD